MARIKSALELALERTQNVQGDRSKLDEYEEKQRGRKVYVQLTENPAMSPDEIRKALQGSSEKNLKWVEAGFLDALLGNLTLPNDSPDIQRLKVIQSGFEAIVRDRKRLVGLFGQLEQFFQQYLSNKQQLIEGLRKQFEPRIRRKEQELAERTGQNIKLDPSSDPEFAGVLKQNLNNLQEQYVEVLEKVRGELTGMYERSK